MAVQLTIPTPPQVQLSLPGGPRRADLVVFDPSGLSLLTATDVQAALEQLDAGVERRSAGTRCIAIGDSVTGNDAVYAGDGDTQVTDSYFTVACALSKQRLRFYRNAGVSGENTSEILARLDADVIAYADEVDFCVVGGGTNDYDGEFTTQAVTEANLQAIYTALRAAGIEPIAQTIPPRNAIPKVYGINKWIRAYCAANGIRCLDFAAILSDPATDDYLAAYTDDGVHPNAAGRRLMGQHVVDELVPTLKYSEGCEVAWTNTDQANIGSVLTNMLQNACMIDDTDVDGVPDDWAVSVNGTSTTTPSLVADGSSGRYWWQLDTTVGGTTRQYQQQVGGGVTWSVGDVLAFSGAFQTEDVEAGGMSYTCRIIFDGTAVTCAPIQQWTTDVADGRFYIETTVPTGTTGIRVYVSQRDGTGTVRWGQFLLRNKTELGLP